MTYISKRAIPRDEQGHCPGDGLFLPTFRGRAEISCTVCGVTYLWELAS